MPATICTGKIQCKLPTGVQHIDLESLTSSTNLTKKYSQAIIHHRYQLNKDPVPSMKLILKNNNDDTIDCLAIGKVADDLDVCEKGDTLVLLKFEVETCPRHSKKRYQVVADDTESVGSNILIFKRKNMVPSVSVDVELKQSDKETTKKSSHTYKTLADVKVNTKVDVYGVVKFFKPSVKTRGTDYCCMMSLTDPSLKNPEDKLMCNIFSQDPDLLPKVEVGNVVRFHRLKIQSYQSQKQGSNGPGFHWVIFNGSVDNRKASSSTYTFEQQDRDKVLHLLNWWSKEGGKVEKVTITTPLSEVKVKEYFNLVCQVNRVCDLKSMGCKLLQVWDGTKFNGTLRKIEEKEFDESAKGNDTLMKVADGFTVDVFVFDNHVGPAGLISPGDFVLMTNLHAALVGDQIELTLHGGTWFNRGIEILSANSEKCAHLKRVLISSVKSVELDHGRTKHQSSARRDKEASSDIEFCENLQQKSDESDIKKKKNKEPSSLESASSDTNRLALTNTQDRQVQRKHNDNSNIEHLQQEKLSPGKRKCSETDKSRDATVAEKKSFVDPCMTNLTHDEDDIQMNVESSSSDNSQSSQSIFLSAYNDSDFESDKQKAEKNREDTGEECLLQMECPMSSQDSFITALSTVSSVTARGENKDVCGEGSIHDVYLSLKRKQAENDSVGILGSDKGLLNLDKDVIDCSVNCFDTTLTNSDKYVGMKEIVRDDSQDSSKVPAMTLEGNVIGTDVSSQSQQSTDNDTESRCMLKTASTVVDHPHVSKTALEDVLDHEVPYKFKIQVRVSEFCPRPSSPTDLVYFYCPKCHYSESPNLSGNLKSNWCDDKLCPNCTDVQSSLKPVIVVRFLLTDSKHQLLANLFDKHAIQFFNGIDPVQLLSNDESFQELQKWLGSLCPLNSNLEDRPLLECCIFSSIVEGEVKYHIFDTVLV